MNINKKMRIFRRSGLYVTWKHIYIALTVLLALIAAITLTLAVMRFVRVGDIVVKGDNPYDRVDIIETLAIRRDSLWWTLDEEALEERLIAERQLIEKVEVKKQFPNRVIINVVESRKPKWFIDISGRKYTLDENLYVIEETKETEGVTRLILPYVSEIFERRVPVFGQSESEVRRTVEMIYAVNNSDIRRRVTALDVSDPTNIIMTVDEIYTVRLGDRDDIEGKLEMVKATLETDDVKNSNGGTIYASTYSQNGYASFKPNS